MLVAKDGSKRRVARDSAAPIKGHDGKVRGAVLVFRDITKTLEDARALRRAHAFLDSVVENIPDMIFVKDATDLAFVRFNRAGEALLGANAKDLIGKTDFAFFPPDQAKFFVEKDRQTLRGAVVVDIGNEIHSPSIRAEAHSGLATLYHKSGRWQDARQHYGKAIDSIETMRAGLPGTGDRAAFLTGRLDVYRGVISLLAALHRQNPSRGYDTEAFHYVERGRARSYLEMIAASRGGRALQTHAAATDRERELRGRIAGVQIRLVEAYAAQRPNLIPALHRELAEADEAYDSYLWEKRSRETVDIRHPEPLEAAEVQRRLGSGRVLLEYSVGKSGSFLFALTADRLRVYRLPVESILERDVARLRAAIAEGPSTINLSNFVTVARSLYGSLVEPASALLQGAKEIVIAPDGVLHYLPFEALLTEMPPATAEINASRLPYLIRDRAMSYTPSFGVLATLDDAARPASLPDATLVAYGDPSYGGETGRAASWRSISRVPIGLLEGSNTVERRWRASRSCSQLRK